MTDYSSLAQTEYKDFDIKVMPYWKGHGDIEVDGIGILNKTISGHVSVDGVAQADKYVYVYYRYTGKLIAAVKTNASGDYSCNILDGTDASSYFAVCVTNSNYNAIIFDKLTAG